MRINVVADQNEAPEGVIIHGSIPTAPRQSCRNCAKFNDCSILQYALTTTEALDFVPRLPGILADSYDMPFPMPCRGNAWQSKPNRTFESNPLVQRLGLADVGEPKSESRG